ncbi:MAG: hypothetical protein J6A47_08950, partial [Bacilli bacterium]|nr:hypothetical protein [Bacilli bacterium]
MKKSLFGIFALSVSLLLASCGGDGETSAPSSASTPSTSQTQPSSESVSTSEESKPSSSEESRPSSSEESRPSSSSSSSSQESSSNSQSSSSASESSQSSSSSSSTEDVVFEVKVNGEPVNIASREDLEGNVKVYDLNLVVGDTVQIVRNGRDLPFNGGTETIFTCRYEGAHIFWVNASLEVWVTEPAAPAVVWEFLIDGTPVNLAPEADPGQDKAVYKTNLEVGQKVAIKEDGKVLHFYATEDGSSVDKGEEFVCKIAGEHVFYINKNNEIWVVEPAAPVKEISVLVNGQVVNLAPEADPGQDKAVYKTTLAVGDKVSFKEGDDFIHFYVWDGEANKAVDLGAEFTAKIAGEHAFWISKNNEIYVGEPTIPEAALVFYVDGEPVNLAPEENPGDNKAVYKITLEVGQKVMIWAGEDRLHFYVSEEGSPVDKGAEFQASVAGEH